MPVTMPYHKVESLKHLNELLGQGFKIYHDKKDTSKWFAIRGTESYYIPAGIRKEAPDLFGGKPIINDVLLKGHVEEPEEQKEKLQELTKGIPETTEEQPPTPTAQTLPAPTTTPQKQEVQPGMYIKPVEFILHDTARRALESVWVLEGFHKIEKQKRHELPFAYVTVDAKGNPQSVVDKFDDKKGIVFSLADLAVYFLIDCYMKYQKADETRISLNVEKTMLYNAYMHEKEKREELEDALMLKTILKI